MERRNFELWDFESKSVLTVGASRQGNTWMALCPKHADSKPSLKIDPDKRRYFCFGCNWKGPFYNPQKATRDLGRGKIVSTFDYKKEDGGLLFQVVRLEPKDFYARRPDGKGGWIWKLDGVDPILFRLPELIKGSDPVFIPEGESHVDKLIEMGFTATCNPFGAGKWRPDFYNNYLKGRKLVILKDNDKPGEDHGNDIASSLSMDAEWIKMPVLPGLPDKGDILDWLNHGGTKEKLLEIVEQTDFYKHPANHTPEEWSDPVRFDEYSSLPDFPADALQGIGREIVEVVSEVNQVDPALTACLYFATLSTCCAKKAVIDLKSHKEPLNFYFCPVYDSGNRKSSTVSDMTKPLYEFQKARQEEMESAIRDAQNTFKIREKRLERLQKKAAEEEDLTKRRQFENEAAKIAQELAENPVPRCPIFLVDDVTPEKLGVLMAENRERMAIITPEGGLFEIMAGRYSNDGVGNIDLFLKAHVGDFWSNHRIGREAKTMQAPALTLCLAIQSEVIEEAGKNRHFRGRGLLARFLYVRCKSQVGYRQRQIINIPSSLIEQYEKHIFSLMDIPFTEINLTLSPEAQRAWDEFYNDIEREMRPDGSLYLLHDWGSKLPGAVARMAGLLHFAEHGTKALSLPISVNLITASCVIGAYFKEHALAVFGLMQEDRRIKLARQILDYIQRKKPESFKGKDVIYHTAIKLMEDVDQGIKVLTDRGYIRVEEPVKFEGPAKRGRPEAVSYRVHPNFLKVRNV